MTYNIDITDLWNYTFEKIETPDGFQDIKAIVTKPKKECVAVLFDNGEIIECSIDHLFQNTSGEWIQSKNVLGQVIQTKDSSTEVIEVLNIGIQDTYDLSVDHINERYYSNGIVSHNTGKTSTATAIIKEINGEALFINASMDNGNDVLRSRITNFAGSESFDGKIKIVVLDEVDNLSQSAQYAFRSLIESFASNCRFILTGNYKEKMLGPLLDRLENYDFNNFSKQDMVNPIFERLKNILENENVKYDPKDLVPIINTYYPSIRSMIGALQKYSTTGTLEVTQSELDNQDEYMKIIETVKNKDFSTTINLVNELTSPDNMYTFIYKNINEFSNMPHVVMTTAKYQFQSNTVRDKNLNLSACLTEIMKGL